MPIELIDAPRFFDALRITHRRPYDSYEEWQELIGDFNEATIYEEEQEGG